MSPKRTKSAKTTIVIGAGIAGLAAAYRLQQQGHSVLVLEAQGSVGGRMGERELRGIVFNAGARLLYPFSKPTMALIAELRLNESLVPIRGLGADCCNGAERWRLELMPGPRSLLTVGLGTIDRLRLAGFAAQLLALRARTDPDDLATGLDHDGESLAAFVTRKLGKRVLARIVEPVFRGTRSWNPEDVSAAFFATTMPHLIGRSTVYGFAKGMGQFPSALAARLDVRCNARAMSVEEEAGKMVVTTQAHGTSERLEADLVVCAVEGSFAQTLIAKMDDADRGFFAKIRYNSLDVFHFRLKGDVAPSMRFFLRGTGDPLAAYQQLAGRPERGVSPQIYAQLAPEAEHDAKTGGDPMTVERRVVDRVRSLFPVIDDAYIDCHHQRINRKLPVFAPGYAKRLRDFRDRGASRRRRLYFCGDYLAQALVTGAVASGLRVAEQVARDWA